MTHSPFDVQNLAHITDTDVSRGSKITPIVTKGRAGRIMSLPRDPLSSSKLSNIQTRWQT